MSQALINRSLTNVRTELEFLYESNVITKTLYDNLIATLPERYTGQPPVDLNTQGAPVSRTSSEKPPLSTHNSSVSNVSTTAEYAEAIYNFQPQQPTDLLLNKGDRIEILERLSPDWWKGRVGHNEGVFPSNYVRLVHNGAPQLLPILTDQKTANSYNQAPFPPPSANFYPPQQQQQPVVAQQQQLPLQQNNSHPHLKKFGKQLKDALVFGAGATIGSDIVNSIF